MPGGATVNPMNAPERERFDRLEAKVDALAKAMEKQKGFIGGVVVTVSSLWAVGLALLAYFRGT